GGNAVENIAYYNGRISSIEEMMIPMNERSSYFGDGVYDAMFTVERVPLQLDDHLRRFYRSAKRIEIEVLMPFDELRAMVLDFCRRVDSPDQMVYVQATRGVGMRGHAYRFAGGTPSLWVWVKPDVLDPMDRDYRCITMEDTRYLHCDIKTLNLLPSVIYTQRAEEAGCDETILHRGERVTECAHSNVHILRDGALKTAPCDNLILPGITRAHRIAQCREMGIPVIEEPFTVQEMMEADEVFFTSASALCCRIREIDGRSVGGRAPELIKRIQDAAWAEALSEVEALKAAVSR
ncbi:MAG: aminotransferase class IV, partial [Candidatus Ventricola sp.]|nr:aminotransferase class IV [Candidatus Ventricola sp.]